VQVVVSLPPTTFAMAKQTLEQQDMIVLITRLDAQKKKEQELAKHLARCVYGDIRLVRS